MHRFDVRSAAITSRLFDIKYLNVGGLLICALLLIWVSPQLDNSEKQGLE